MKIENNMQTTFRLNVNELDYSFIEQLKELFKNKEVKISVEEVERPVNQREILKSLKALRKKYPPRIISPDIDIQALLKEINNVEL
jgi:flagellar biosynthesis regulator FlbT